MGPDGIRVKGGQKLQVNYYFRTENPKLREMTAFIQAQMKPVGVDVQLIGQAGPAYFQSVRTGLHHVQYWWDTGTDPGQMLRILYHSSNAGGGSNRNNYRNAEMDALIDQIGAEGNPQKRRELLIKAQQKALDEQIMIFLTDPPSLFAHQRTVSDIWVDWGGLYPYFYDTRIAR
jgi:ABC-type transport system substrate-binding protein